MSTIILCADGSELSIRAAIAGLAVLQKPDRLVVATVVDPPDEALINGSSGFAGGVISPEEFTVMYNQNRTDGEAVAREMVRAIGVEDAETMVVMGAPGSGLCALATELSATTIVLGSRGRSGIKRAVLGSVSDHVTRHAPCPVLVVGHGD